MNSVLDSIIADCHKYTSCGHVATYIPELANVDANQLGIYVLTSTATVSQEFMPSLCLASNLI